MGTQNNNGKGLSFAKRIYLPRTIGSCFGLIAVLGALYPLAPPTWMWAAAVINGLGWPHLAYQLARRSRSPYRAEQRNLLWDSLSGGFWAAAMHFNPLPSITVLAMMTMDNVAAGGRPLFLRGALVQLLGAAIGTALLGFGWQPVVTQTQVWACLPMLTLYPFALGWVSYTLALQLSEHKRELSALSRTDSLTGLLNHGAWKDLLQLKFHKCRQERCDAVIAIIDVDHFKHINDNYGHIVGDSVLRQLTTELRRTLRDCDLAGRYGGDEFCVILPRVSVAQANDAMERVRLALHRYRHSLEPHLRVTLSIGLAAFRSDFSEPANWLHEADKALYVAKNNGRNRVSISGLQQPHTVM
ncbi:diguanylate cyclase [Pseudomonas sp. dw_358]|uniref:diguanylate cyclase n=1 Tax=Pseudomonas sp. dw_358 TaxID=2720083 RepID=UPI001BD672BF|nr:diguanylate cyclase [Pseudomonas sp. dw_358]